MQFYVAPIKKVPTSFCSFVLTVLASTTVLLGVSAHSPVKEVEELRQKQQHEASIDVALNKAYHIYTQNFEQADSVFTYVIRTARKNHWPEKRAFGHLYRGITQYLNGAYPQAHQQYFKALHLFDSLSLDSGMGRTYNELAVFYHKTKDTAKAFVALDSAYHFCRKAGDRQGMGTALEHRASFLFRKQKYSEAKAYMDRVLALRQKTKDSVGLSYVYLNLAEYHTVTGAFAKALERVRQSTQLRRALGDTQGVIVNTVITGEVQLSQKNYEAAIHSFKKGRKRARAIGFADLERYAHDMLEQCYLALEDYQSAYTHALEGARAQDSIFNLEKARAISELETQYQTEQKEQKIALQQATLNEQAAIIERNTLFIAALILVVALLAVIYFLARYRFRKRRELLEREQELRLQKAQIEATLRSQEEERKRVARDLHDGFGQLIAALRMQLDSAEDHLAKATPQALQQAESLLEQMHTEIRSAAFNLMPQVLIDGGLVPALQSLSDKLSQGGQVQISTRAYDMEERLDETREVALYRIVQEWLTNVLKYARASSVHIQLLRHEEELSLTIEDDGRGFDPAQLEQSEGNGWRNIQLRLQMIRGQGEVDSRPDLQGTTFIIQCPLNKENQRESKASSVATLS